MTYKPGTTIHETPPRPFIACGFMPCGNEALVRVKNMNVCQHHYVTLGQKEADEHARRNGLVTAADHRAYIRKLLNTPRDYRAWMKNPKSEIARRYAAEVRRHEAEITERVPGEDDEPMQEAA